MVEKRKLTTMEKRAKSACDAIRAGNLTCFGVEWVKSRTWGNCPRIMHRGEKAAHASGCGYDKLSAVLCDFLADLVPGGIPFHGAGVSSVIDFLAKHGWELKHTYDGKSEDAFEIRRVVE